VVVTASDGTLSASRTFTWTATNANRTGVLTSLVDRTDAEIVTVSLLLAATDPDGDTLTYSATGLPSGLTINSVTGTITGTLAYDSAGPHTVVVTASDGTLSDSRTFSWTVTNVNRAPVLTAIGNQTHLENASVTLNASATDPDGDSLTFSAMGLPAGVTITPAGTISGTLTYASAAQRPYAVTVTATDLAGATG